MPCESCNVQFTVFKRKRLCSECRRFYCNHCLVKRNERILCERCIVLTARPLSKIDLLKLKPKDLIFFLQSKHISTTGCVEKEELVNLVLIHVNGAASNSNFTSNTTTPQSGTREIPTDETENGSNPFDHIKQTCQSLFNSFTEKIVDLNFDNKTPSNAADQAPNIYNQPRAQTRELPTYASSTAAHTARSGNQQSQSTVPRSRSSRSNVSNANRTGAHSSASSSNPSSPIVSIGSISSQSLSSQPPISANPRIVVPTVANDIPSVHRDNTRRLIDNLQDANASGCECSDDEVITKFKSRHRNQSENQSTSNVTAEKLSPPSQTDSAFEDQIPGPSGSGGVSGSPSKTSSGDNQKSSEESSGSSFEELGAVGGTSDQEHWQFVNRVELQPPVVSTAIRRPQPDPSSTPSTSSANATFQLHSSISNLGDERSQNMHKARRIIRRRSDGFIHHTPNRSQTEMSVNMELDEESDDTSQENLSRKRVRKCCNKCGKTKNSLKRQLLKFRRQLESAHMSETEIKQEIEEFLNYLETRAKESFEYSDSESNMETTAESEACSLVNPGTDMVESFSGRDDDGIHVYAHKDDKKARQWRHDSRFLNLGDFKCSSELDDLSVKQLKELLMLNRVDYKGCCEKQELLERVNRLWNDLQTSPAVDKLPTDDLCKICMDAPIECVILECGHMATCTNCGKVLSECPICRQYIVRVVRFFRA